MNRINSPKFNALSNFTLTGELKNEKNVSFEFIQTIKGKVSINYIQAMKKYSYICYLIPSSIIQCGENYILILEWKVGDGSSHYYRLERMVFPRSIDITKKKGLGKHSVFICSNESPDIMEWGEYIVHVYKQKHISDPNELFSINLSEYIKKYLKMTGCYITDVNIKDVDKKRIVLASGKKSIQSVQSITFQKSQTPRSGNHTIIIIENPDEFKQWVDSISTKQQTTGTINGIAESKLREIILKIIATDKKFDKDIHPYYRTDIIKNVITDLQSKITDEFWNQTFESQIKEVLKTVRQPQYRDIMHQREERYRKLSNGSELDMVKVTIFLKDHEIDETFVKKIRSDYLWYLLNEATELVNTEIKSQGLVLTPIEKKKLIIDHIKQIEEFEDKHYSDEKERMGL